MISKTKSGLFIREDKNLGLMVYSPYTGLFFCCVEEEKEMKHLLFWLNGKTKEPLSDKYLQSIGAGWCYPRDKVRHHGTYVLSTKNEGIQRWPEKPLLVNWIITGQCNYHCIYCYAQDLMHQHQKEPEKGLVLQTAENILSYSPLAVVLTGGEPLCSPNLDVVIKTLHNKTGIIIDTNGSLVSKNHVDLFKKYNIFVRVSLDSEQPRKNQILRPSRNEKNTLEKALHCIKLCNDADVPVGVQTVITRKNMSDVISIRDTLHRIGGVKIWRLLLLTEHSAFPSYKQWKPNEKRFYQKIAKEVKSGSDNTMSIQIVHSNAPDAVILVSQNGHFMTEKEGGKIPIDKNSSYKPSLQSFKDVIDRAAHLNRYLNSTDIPATYIGK